MLPPGVYGIVFGRVHLEELSNVLKNAAKFAPKGRAITLDLQALGQEAIVRLSMNSGLGTVTAPLQRMRLEGLPRRAA